MARVGITTVGVLLVCVATPAVGWQGAGKSQGASQSSTASDSQRQWELVFAEEITPEEYARQIDFLKVEIAAISKNGRIEYVSAVTRNKPERRVSYLESEYRLRIDWKSGPLHAVDRKLLRKAGINSDKKELTHYFPIAAQKEMENLEQAYAGRKPHEIRRTRFQVKAREEGEGYEIVVVEQDPPKPAETSAPVESSLRSKTE
jgi:hypothetical protein